MAAQAICLLDSVHRCGKCLLPERAPEHRFRQWWVQGSLAFEGDNEPQPGGLLSCSCSPLLSSVFLRDAE
jgi:hypothetical protein